MISRDHTAAWGRDVTLLLGDYHREYTGVLDEISGTYDDSLDGDEKTRSYVRASVVWDQYELIDTIADLQEADQESAESAVHRMQAEIFAGFEEELAESPHVWRIMGSPYGLARAFNALANALNVDTVGGDDDAFDYWPNTMDMLHEFARDLDRIHGTDHFGKLVEEIAANVLDRTASETTGTTHSSETKDERRDFFAGEWGYPERWERYQD
jgi:hypothetical protein